VQLENAGIKVSPAERIRVQHQIAANQDLLYTKENKAKLGQLIAPLVCRNEAEQRNFYTVFEEFLRYLNQEPKDFDAKLHEKVSIKSPCFGYFWWLLGLLVVALVFGIWKYCSPPQHLDVEFCVLRIIPQEKGVDTILIYDGDSLRSINAPSNLWQVAEGDTLRLINTTKGQNANARFIWKTGRSFGILDSVGSDSVFLFTPSLATDTTTVSIALEAQSLDGGKLLGASKREIGILCKNPPAKGDSITYKGNLLTGENIRFFAPKQIEKHWQLSWDFGDGSTSTERNPIHRYSAKNEYTATLKITDTTSRRQCDTELSRTLKLNDEVPVLAELDLYAQAPVTTWHYRLWLWLTALGLLSLGAFLLWRWLRRKGVEQPLPELQVPAALRRAMQPKDNNPYAIPYRNNHKQIVQSEEQLALANILRRRQEGNVELLHIQKTISATIKRIGFVDFQFEVPSKPTHYLFLIDKEQEMSHQAQLFQYLTEMLGQQDVLFDLLYYRTTLDRFWSQAQPDGLNLDQVTLLYGDRRLVVFGKAHRLVSEIAGEKLVKDQADPLNRWQSRILVTPLPQVNWSYVEARLYTLFPVFTADLNGLLQAANWLDQNLNQDGLPPTFAEWQKSISRSVIDIDTERLWRSPDQHRAYLSTRPGLYTWIRALAVHPETEWHITIAIGKALGLDTSYENLLVLARIPWLHQGGMPPALWKAFWDDMPKDQETIARKAVRDELLAIADQAAPGFADQKVQIGIAVQNFALEPDITEHQDAIRFVLEEIQPSQKFWQELDLVVERHLPGAKDGQGNALKAATYLKREPQTVRPNRYGLLYLAVGFLTLGIILTSSLIGSNKFKNTLESAKLKYYFGFWKSEHEDEAARLNNLAVEVWQTKDPSKGIDGNLSEKKPYVSTRNYSNSTASLLSKAFTIRSDYGLAQANLSRVHLSDARYYIDQKDWKNALYALNQAQLTDSLSFEFAHAKTIVFYHTNQKDSACFYRERILNEQRSNYFDWLGALGVCKPLTFKVTALLLDSLSRKPLGGVRLESDFGNFLSNQNGIFSYTFKPKSSIPAQVSIKVSKDGYVEMTKLLMPKSIDLVDTLILVSKMDQVLLDRDGDGVPDDRDGCPDDKIKTAPGLCGCGLPDMDTNRDGKCDTNEPPPIADRDGDGTPDTTDGCPDDKNKTEPGLCGCGRPNLDANANGKCDADELPNRPNSTQFIEPTMLLIKGGTFTMGCNDKVDKYCEDDEKPLHEVTLNDYYMSETEITQKQWRDIMDDNPSSFKNCDQCPVEQVSWDDVQGFLKKLNDRYPGKNYRLPTEAEWEYAARGGQNAKDGFWYAGGNEIKEFAWVDANSDNQTHPVKQKKPNQLDLYDMSGNVWEWCSDWYDDYAKNPQLNPIGPRTGSLRVLRGGSWGTYSQDCRVSNRYYDTPHIHRSSLGFRVVSSSR
jgi:formylglycine-generating enzyme required for sulfatase activity